jgi:hypothetical protein
MCKLVYKSVRCSVGAAHNPVGNVFFLFAHFFEIKKSIKNSARGVKKNSSDYRTLRNEWTMIFVKNVYTSINYHPANTPTLLMCVVYVLYTDIYQ